MPFTLKALVLSLFSKDFYRQAAHEQKGIGAKFLVLISLIITIKVMAVLIVFINAHKQDIDDFINSLPVVTLEKEGGISIDKPSPYIMGDKDDTLVYIDTEKHNNASTDEIFAIMKEKDIEIFVTKYKLFMKKSNNETRVYDLSEKREESFVVTKEIIRAYTEKTKLFAAPIIGILIILSVFVYKMLQMVLYSFFGFIVNSMSKKKLESSSIHRICAYALWPATLASIVLDFTSYELITILSILITIIYVVFGMKAATTPSTTISKN